MSFHRVVVTGLGQVAPHGRDVAAGFEALLNGHSAIRLNNVGDAPHETTVASAVCEAFDAAALLGRARASTMDRVAHLSAVAAQSAWADAGLDTSGGNLGDEERERSCVMWGTGGAGIHTMERSYRDLFVKGRPRVSPLSVVMGMHNASAGHLAMMFGLGGPCFTYSVACASGAAAIAEAARRVRWGECAVALTGGAEASMPYGMVKAWQSMQVLAGGDEASVARCCRPFSTDRSGLVLGEGAAALVLESLEHAQARGARIYAELVGAASSNDHSHLTAPDAGGQLRALQGALRDGGLAVDELRYINAHGTATTEGDPVEAEALRRLLGDRAPQVAVSATKALHGHLMGAAGALEALITVMAVHTGHIPATAGVTQIDPACAGLDHVLGAARHDVEVTAALSNSFAFGGSNVVLAFRRHAAR